MIFVKLHVFQQQIIYLGYRQSLHSDAKLLSKLCDVHRSAAFPLLIES